ncbi:MAG: glycosyltransferase [Phycisphaeraceae bacterium]|nr:glycosyltransferase [Phycisphaeraceae bacterium]
MQPVFSILTPCLNQARFLERNLRSVAGQASRDVEHIVIDGGSTDGGVEMLRRHGDSLAHWVSEPDGGQADALRKALSVARGEWIGWLNADEFYEPGALDHVRAAMDKHPDAELVYGNVRRVDAEGHAIRVNRQWRFDYDVCRIQTPIIINCGAFFRRQRLIDRGGFDPSWHYILDWEMYIRYMRGKPKWLRLKQVLGNFTMHAQSKTATSQEAFEAEIQRLRQREFPGWTPQQIDAEKRRQHARMMQHMLLDGVLFEKAYFKLVRQRNYAHLFGDPGVRVPVVSRVLDLVAPVRKSS